MILMLMNWIQIAGFMQPSAEDLPLRLVRSCLQHPPRSKSRNGTQLIIIIGFSILGGCMYDDDDEKGSEEAVLIEAKYLEEIIIRMC
jgi:hypothetical protein